MRYLQYPARYLQYPVRYPQYPVWYHRYPVWYLHVLLDPTELPVSLPPLLCMLRLPCC